MKKKMAKSGKALASKATNDKKQNQCSLFARLTTTQQASGTSC